MKIVIIISLFVSLICTSQGSSTQSNIEKMNERNFEEKLSEEALQELGEVLKNGTFIDEYKQQLKLLGEAIFAGKIVDDKDPEQLKLLGKAILEEKLTTDLKKLLGDFLISIADKTESEKKFRQLLEIFAKNETVADTRPGQSQIQGDAPAPPNHNDSGHNGHELTSVDDEDAALKHLKEVLKSDKFLTEDKEQTMNLISKVLGSEKLLNNEHQETFRLLGRVLSFRKFVDSNYPKTLKLLGDAIVSNQISINRNNETLKFISNVFIKKNTLDKEAYKQLAEMLVKKERSENNVSKPQASTIDIIQEPPLPLSDEAIDESNENQVSHNENSLNETTPNDGLPNEQDSTTVDQNAENASVEITESAEPKKRGKRSSKSNVKFKFDSLESRDKSKELRKKSPKKNKRSRRSTKGIPKPTSKNKHKRSKRKKSKERTTISGQDGVSNAKDTDMMGDDPNTNNPSTHSESPFTKTVDTKATVVDPKTNAPSSTSNKNDNSKLFNSYYPEEYKRFVPLNPAIAYRRPNLLFLNDDNQVVPKLKTVDSGKSQGDYSENDDLKPQKIVEVPKDRLFLTFTVSRSVQ